MAQNTKPNSMKLTEVKTANKIPTKMLRQGKMKKTKAPGSVKAEW